MLESYASTLTSAERPESIEEFLKGYHDERAKAFAESDPERAIAAFHRATEINPGVARRINPTWRLADLLQDHGLG